ncbi:hypothetical protein NW755_003109 [Fusarium falciforme]|uniref:Uncharacterized protein n=1 Tax=Fusarium falciforme TaxID=195108 RepID=A0A9W8RFH7_9HYPO|nr:hypothetical protein NW755_003109 [Fusarium falciforme]
MCDYFYVEFRCRHHAWVVRKWCRNYERNEKPCTPNVVDPPEFWYALHHICIFTSSTASSLHIDVVLGATGYAPGVNLQGSWPRL